MEQNKRKRITSRRRGSFLGYKVLGQKLNQGYRAFDHLVPQLRCSPKWHLVECLALSEHLYVSWQHCFIDITVTQTSLNNINSFLTMKSSISAAHSQYEQSISNNDDNHFMMLFYTDTLAATPLKNIWTLN